MTRFRGMPGDEVTRQNMIRRATEDLQDARQTLSRAENRVMDVQEHLNLLEELGREWGYEDA